MPRCRNSVGPLSSGWDAVDRIVSKQVLRFLTMQPAAPLPCLDTARLHNKDQILTNLVRYDHPLIRTIELSNDAICKKHSHGTDPLKKTTGTITP